MISVTVGAGDTVYRLALKYGVPVAAILAANHIDGAGKIRVGQQLLIPSATTDESDHPLPAIPPALPESTLAIERAKFRLPASQYFQEEFDKDLIVLHFTAGMSAQSASSAWTSTPVQVATPYVVDPDGTIHEFFDPRYWAYHLGVPGSASDGYRHDRRSIPIEIANVGPLKTDPANPKRLNWWPPANPGTGQSEFRTKWCMLDESDRYLKASYRGYDYFASFPSPQIASVAALVHYLSKQFSIPLELPGKERRGSFDLPFYAKWKGVASHQNFRADKTDIGPAFDWDKLNA